MQSFDDTLLSNYMEDFWGYGTINADYWFVGMEEGGGYSFEEVNQRICQWEKRGRNTFEDIYDYHMDINVPKWFRENAPIQPTWKHLIRVLLSAQGKSSEAKDVRTYQINRLGRSNGEVCLMELLPLPSPNKKSWLYDKHSKIPYLSNRDIYTKEVGKNRANIILKLIKEQQPKFVLFYGESNSHLAWLNRISNIKLIQKTLNNNKKAFFGKYENTVIAVSEHPTAWGVTSAYFNEIGKNLSEFNL